MSRMRGACAAKVETLCVTVDTPIGGVRENEVRNGFRSASRLTFRLALALARKPGWCARILRRGVPEIGNLAGMPQYASNALEQAANLAAHIDASMTWDDIVWIRKLWPGKLALKGVLHPLDAAQAAKVGADGLVVSNHGGRRLDCAASTISMLARIVEAVGEQGVATVIQLLQTEIDATIGQMGLADLSQLHARRDEPMLRSE